MFGTITDEIEIKAAASAAWEILGTIRLSQIVAQHPEFVERIDVLEGDGGVGTVLKIIRPPGSQFSYYIEKFTVVDNEKRVKVAEGIEGGFLDLGLDVYRVRFQVIEKQRQGDEEEDSCITRATVEYETEDVEAAKVAVDSLPGQVATMQLVADYLTKSN